MGESEIKREIERAKARIKSILSGTATPEQIRKIEDILDDILTVICYCLMRVTQKGWYDLWP